ncbi:transposase, partial [Desulforhopalus singaporensis]
PKQTSENAEKIRKMKEQRIRDSRERIPIEGKFGQGKNGYRLNYIRAKLQKTSEAWINCIFLVMNLMVLLKKLGKNLTLSLLAQLFRLCSRIIAAILERASVRGIAGPRPRVAPTMIF